MATPTATPAKTKSRNNIRARIKEVAAESFINATDEFCDKVEEELEKTITPEFLEKVRASIIKSKTKA